jgi:hypothetical protein
VSRLQPALAVLALATGIGAAACGEEEALPDSSDLGGFLGLEDGASWTYRADVDTGAAEPEDLLAARFEGGGRVALRDNARWADGTDAGHLEWAEGGGLALVGWELGAESGSEPVTLVAEGAESGDSATRGGLTCTATFPTAVTSWYADFEEGLLVDCEGPGGLAGQWSFAWGFGLVRLQIEAQTLDLVAPW